MGWINAEFGSLAGWTVLVGSVSGSVDGVGEKRGDD